jgi:hypothetical protein
MIDVLLEVVMAAPGVILLALSAAVGGWNPTLTIATALIGSYLLGRHHGATFVFRKLREVREALEAKKQAEHDES